MPIWDRLRPQPEGPRQTSHGLPVVTQETAQGIIDRYSGNDGSWGKHIQRVWDDLQQDNPVLAGFITNQVGSHNPLLHQRILSMVVGTLAVLQEQAIRNGSFGLPKVTEGSMQALFEVYTGHESWVEHLRKVQERLDKENPWLARFIASQTNSKSEDFEPIMEEVVGTLAVLEHQAANDKLSARFA